MEFSSSLSIPPCPACPRSWPTPRLEGPCPPSGPTPSPYCFIGEAPAKNEDRHKIPFCGATGSEFDRQYLPTAGLTREQCYVTNAMKCSLPQYRNPEPAMACQCAARHLPAELRACHPEVVVPMGVVACSAFDRPIDLETQYGYPQLNTLYGNEYLTVPMYHPASGLHETRQMTLIQEQFTNLGSILRGDLSAPRDPYPHPDYRRLTDPRDVAGILAAGDPWDIAMDTEDDRGVSWCVSFSNQEGTGYVIRAVDPDALAALWGWVGERGPQIWLHYALHDIPHLLALGGDRDTHFLLDGLALHRVRDTMMELFHLGTTQGLKVNAYRRLGMRMRDWSAVTTPHAIPEAYDYLCRLASLSGLPQPWLKPRQWKLPRKAASAVKAFDKSPTATNLFDRVKGWDGRERDLMDKVLGPFPWPSIALVPESESIPYAAADADATFRLRRHVRRENAQLRRQIHFRGMH